MQNYNGKLEKINRKDVFDIISKDEIKKYLNIPTTITSKDLLIENIFNAGVDTFERLTAGGVLNTNYKYSLYGFNNKNGFDNAIADINNQSIVIYYQFINEITSIKYYQNNIQLTLDNTKYYFENMKYKTIIYPTEESNFNIAIDIINNKTKLGVVEIEFVSGFGEDNTTLPADIKLAFLKYIASHYNCLGDCECENNANTSFEREIAEYYYRYL